MNDQIKELQRLTGIGAVTAQRLITAGLETFAAIAAAGEERLAGIPGVKPKDIPAILEQAAALSCQAKTADSPPTDTPVADSPAADSPPPSDDLKLLAQQLRTAIQEIALAARERFPEELAGKIGHKLTRNMVAGLDALYAIEELTERRPKRSRKALCSVQKKVEGLAEGELPQIRKGLKRVRKTLQRVIS